MENLYVKLAAYREIETERLHLRPVTLEDAPAMFEYASDETVTRYTFPTNQSLEETRNNIALFYLASPLGRWGIELKEKAVIALAFEQLGMNKLIAVHDKDNPASGRVMAKSGMKYSHEEPYAMLDLHEKGRMVTRVHYILTKEEYLAEK